MTFYKMMDANGNTIARHCIIRDNLDYDRFADSLKKMKEKIRDFPEIETVRIYKSAGDAEFKTYTRAEILEMINALI